jgi:hypothetical protein
MLSPFKTNSNLMRNLGLLNNLNKLTKQFFSTDANGIIMGEFGFITADGVYHVTVYATDIDGNFKILSMKNIRLMNSRFH